MEQLNTPQTALLTAHPSIFDESDNVYNTYPLPSEDPRQSFRYERTGAHTPRVKRARS